MRTKWHIFLAFVGMQLYELFKDSGIKYHVPLQGFKFDGDRYDITLPLETIVWFFFAFVMFIVMMRRIYELERTRDNLILLYCFVFLLFDMLVIMNKPYGWWGVVPVGTDLIIGSVMVGLLFKKNIVEIWNSIKDWIKR